MDNDEIIELIKRSLDEIAERDYNINNPKIRYIDGENIQLNYSQNSTNPERNFVSALRSNIDGNIKLVGFNNNDHPELFPQSDFGKKIQDIPDHLDLKKIFNINNTIVPDLFFHKSQDDNNPENQKVVLECKTEDNINEIKIKKDLAKLILYIEQLNYQKAILLVCNNEVSIIEDYVTSFKETFSNHTKTYLKIEVWVKNFNKDLIII